ncbi:hypothetical protein AMELA_G00198480, partial [Ameiurus melas]
LHSRSAIWCQCEEVHSKQPIIRTRITRNLEPIPGSIGHKAGYTLDRVPVHCRAQSHTHSHTHSYTTDTPISLPHYGHFRHANQPTFGLGEETGVPGGNPRSTGRTCKFRTHVSPAGIEPQTLEVGGANVLTTKPPCAPLK